MSKTVGILSPFSYMKHLPYKCQRHLAYYAHINCSTAKMFTWLYLIRSSAVLSNMANVEYSKCRCAAFQMAKFDNGKIMSFCNNRHQNILSPLSYTELLPCYFTLYHNMYYMQYEDFLFTGEGWSWEEGYMDII